MKLVVDASVTVKWLLDDPEREVDTQEALTLMGAVVCGAVTVLQPPHWLVEVAGVLARESPESSIRDVQMLWAMSLPVANEPGILRRACELAIETKQHLFDTLYHAIALETRDTLLVTADENYVRKAGHHGCVRLLRELRKTPLLPR